MLKMKINNEEVVCDKEFTITKDILTTSSTTLKNCYPKSWEENKDYVSNFYFPKDFSKCIIYDEEKIPGIPGLTAEGTNINLTYDNTLEKEITKISGDTYQQTYTGKNLLHIADGTYSNQGYTIVVKNGKIIVNGTGTATPAIVEIPLLNSITVPANTTVKISAFNPVAQGNTTEGGSYFAYRIGTSSNSNILSAILGNVNATASRSWTSQQVITRIQIRGYNGGVFNNFVLYPQIEVNSDIGYYEPYVGGIPSPNPDYPQNIEVVTGKQNIQIVGKNLFDKNNADIINAHMSVSNRTIVLQSNSYIAVIPCKPNTTYTFQKLSNNRFVVMQSPTLLNVTSTAQTISNVQTFGAATSGTITTLNDINYIYFEFYSGTDTSAYQQVLDSIQIEEGSTATEYEEFKEQTYQIDLAEYDNLFTSTLESGGISSIDGQNIDNEDYLRTTSYINVDGTKHYTIEFTKEVTMEVYYYLANNNYIGWEAFGGENKYTFYPENVDKIKIVIRDNTITTDDIMLTEGSDITPSKYIELCKIGNYQDYIYKENNRWYLYKIIGKVVLNGTESGWSYNSANVYFGLNNYLDYLYSDGNITYYCDKYIPLAQTSQDTAFKNNATNYNYAFNFRSTSSRLRIKNIDYTDINNFKTNLGTNPITLYYILETPTVTQITDVNLINQLEGLPLYEGINNITMINGNLTSSIKIHYNYENPTTIIDTIFSGLVKNTGNISLNPRDPHYCSLQILDFKDLLSTGETLDFVINEKTVQEAIQMVVDEISDYGFQVGTINLDSANEVIGTYSTLNKTAYDVFQYLANITQSKWFTRMIDDNNIAIDFYDIDKLDTKNDIEYTEQYFENNNIVDISYNYSTKDYRNKQIMLSNEVFANIDYNDTIITDGYNKIFTIGNNIGVLKNLSLNGVPMSVGTSDDKDRGIIADFYYTVGSNIIESDSLISAGGEIEFTYTPLVKGRQIIVNDDEINRVGSQINRNGTISRYETRNDSLSAEELQNIGESYIKYKGKAEITLKVKTINNDLYNIGDMVYFQAPLNDLQVQYMVKKKTINVLATTGDIFYTYELSNTYNSENEINYFDNQRAKANGNISSNDYITRNIDIDNNATIIFNNLGIQEITATGDNILDCALNSPFNN